MTRIDIPGKVCGIWYFSISKSQLEICMCMLLQGYYKELDEMIHMKIEEEICVGSRQWLYNIVMEMYKQ